MKMCWIDAINLSFTSAINLTCNSIHECCNFFFEWMKLCGWVISFLFIHPESICPRGNISRLLLLFILSVSKTVYLYWMALFLLSLSFFFSFLLFLTLALALVLAHSSSRLRSNSDSLSHAYKHTFFVEIHIWHEITLISIIHVSVHSVLSSFANCFTRSTENVYVACDRKHFVTSLPTQSSMPCT